MISKFYQIYTSCLIIMFFQTPILNCCKLIQLMRVPKTSQHHLLSTVLLVIMRKKEVQSATVGTQSKELCTSLIVLCQKYKIWRSI